jgi:hypothetical protein
MHPAWFITNIGLECVCVVKKRLMYMQLGASTTDQEDNINTFVSSRTGIRHLYTTPLQYMLRPTSVRIRVNGCLCVHVSVCMYTHIYMHTSAEVLDI